MKTDWKKLTERLKEVRRELSALSKEDTEALMECWIDEMIDELCGDGMKQLPDGRIVSVTAADAPF